MEVWITPGINYFVGRQDRVDLLGARRLED